MSDLEDYYERLLDVLKADVESLLAEPDLAKRSPKQIKSYLDLMAECEAKLDSFNDLEADWDKLSPEARRQIEDIIKNDR